LIKSSEKLSGGFTKLIRSLKDNPLRRNKPIGKQFFRIVDDAYNFRMPESHCSV